MRKFVLVLAIYCSFLTTYAEDEYWNQFRGPNGDGRSKTQNLPLEFTESQNVRWKIPIHDQGWSSPVVWGKQIWLTTAREDGTELFAVCIDLDSGKMIHDIKVFDVADPQSEHPGLNSHASPTPIIEKGRIYVHFGTYGTACLDTETGRKLWERRDLNCDHRVRPASSPIIDDELIFLVYDGVDVQFITALDKESGQTHWLENRKVKNDLATVLTSGGIKDIEETLKEKLNDNRKSYATPTIIEHNGQKQLISPAAEATFAYDPQTGKELWRVHHQGWGWNVACRPIYSSGLVFFTTGVAKTLLAVDPSGSGDVTNTHVVWSHRRGSPEIPSPIVKDNLIFFTNEGGVVSCLEAKTGHEIWKGRIHGNHWASPVYADKRIYFLNKGGKVSVISADREFKLLAENELNASFIASPAVVKESMILRSETHLYHLANGFSRVIAKDENLRKIEGKRARGAPKKLEKKKNDKLGKGKRKKEKSAKNLGNIQLEAEGWISYFRTSSAQKIRQAIESEKFQKLAPKAQEEILNQAKKFLSQKDE